MTAEKSGWQLSGDSATAWERYLVPACVEPWAKDLVNRCGLRAGDRVLDVACGSGVVARLAAKRIRWNGTVTGLDLNAKMLAVAKAQAALVEPAIDWVEGNAAALPFKDSSFDAILCQFAVQFFPDKVAALKEMRRVVAPGGRLLFNVWRGAEHNPGWRPLADALDKHVGKEAGDTLRSVFPAGSVSELRSAVSDAGWKDVHVEIQVHAARYPSARDFVRWELESMPTQHLMEAFGRAADAIADDVAAATLAYADDNGVVFPCQAYVVEARC